MSSNQANVTPKAAPETEEAGSQVTPIPSRSKAKKGNGKRPMPRIRMAEPPAPAPRAAPRRRHRVLWLGFILIVVVPVIVAGSYLYRVAADQYASSMGFSVRKEEAPSPGDIFAGIPGFSASSSSDTDILYEFIQSQGLVEQVDADLDLRAIYSKAVDDPVFAIKPNASIEDLVSYWSRMVTVYYDSASGLIETRVLAFDPVDARRISQAIFTHSSRMINDLSAIARQDTTRFALEELERSQDRLKEARSAVTTFRSQTQIVDPNADIQGRMGLLNTLQAQLAESFIELDLLRDNTREGDPRIRQAEARIKVIEARIDAERAKFGQASDDGERAAYATLVGTYEGLIVEREFAEKTYLTALANYDVALAEAQRQSRYLAPYIVPTLAEKAEYPQRELLLGLTGLISILIWSVLALVYYSVRDRR